MRATYKKGSLYCITHKNTNPVFMVTELTDDVSFCSYLVEHTYLSAFYKTIIIVILVILFVCVVAIM